MYLLNLNLKYIKYIYSRYGARNRHMGLKLLVIRPVVSNTNLFGIPLRISEVVLYLGIILGLVVPLFSIVNELPSWRAEVGRSYQR